MLLIYFEYGTRLRHHRRTGIWCLFDPWTWIRDPGSQTHIFLELSDKFLGKIFYNSLKTGPNFFLHHFKNKMIFYFVKFVATKKGMTTNFFHPSLLLRFLDPLSGTGKKSVSGIRDKHPRSATLHDRS